MAEERIEDRADDAEGQMRRHRVSTDEPDRMPEDDVDGARRRKALSETGDDVEGHHKR